ncbi:Metallo-dependent phosphatase-like protein [Gigaspora rosea]|uniref:Metallo-dependent phosphatase-like protein n=1 Tax=Gigaspora rosea TaxID=44941 RepID=A0A397U0V7_9GLOM|nr:Metallo-dependent phosphatase-like protein [Gigaspora rosea]
MMKGIFVLICMVIGLSIIYESESRLVNFFYWTSHNQIPIQNQNQNQNKKFTGKFLHITDLHIDPDYTYPSDPTKFCHRKSHDSSKNTGGKFGALGDLGQEGCDSPLELINETFEYINKNFRDVDFVIYTGDTVRHNFDPYYKLSKEDVLDDHRRAVSHFMNTFDSKRTKIIPTLGNNDEWAHNVLPAGPNALLNNITEIWSPYDLNLTSDFTIGGYFRQDIHPKLSILSLNSMYFYTENPEINDCNKRSSPGAKQLKWLKSQLKSARKEHRNVYIMQHVPPLYIQGQAVYYPTCLHGYVQLIGQYSDIIYGHFTGHTDQDTLTFITASRKHKKRKYKLVLVKGTERPSKKLGKTYKNVVLVLNNAPSVVTVHNPAFRIYEYSTHTEDFGTLLDYTQYYTNLTEANEKGKLRWDIEYKARDFYKISKLRSKDWAKVFHRFKKPDRELWEKYVKHVNVSGT